MNQSLHNGADAYLSRYEGLRDRLPGDAAIRDAAAAVPRAMWWSFLANVPPTLAVLVPLSIAVTRARP